MVCFVGSRPQHIPDSLGKLKKLEELDMSNNSIQTLPDCFYQLTNLQRIILTDNPLQEEVKDRLLSVFGDRVQI